MVRLARNAGDRQHATAAERPDQAPGKIAERCLIDTGTIDLAPTNSGPGDLGPRNAGEQQDDGARDADTGIRELHERIR